MTYTLVIRYKDSKAPFLITGLSPGNLMKNIGNLGACIVWDDNMLRYDVIDERIDGDRTSHKKDYP